MSVESANLAETHTHCQSIWLNENEFRFNVEYRHKVQNVETVETIIILGSRLPNNEYEIYYRMQNQKQKKQRKLSPSWLQNKAPKHVLIQILQILFMVPTDRLPKTKPDCLALCFEKLAFTKSNNRLRAKQLLLFNDEEIELILKELQKQNQFDLDSDLKLLSYLHSNANFGENERFMDMIVYAMTSTEQFEHALDDLLAHLTAILKANPSERKFEHEYCQYHRSRHEHNSLSKLVSCWREENLGRFGIQLFLFTSIVLSSIKRIFIAKLTKTVHAFVDKPVEESDIITTAQAASYGGASVCSLLRIYYARNIHMKTREAHITLIRKLLCRTDEERNAVPKEIQYENEGYLYLLSPKLYKFIQTILNFVLNEINRAFKNSPSLPDFEAVISSHLDDCRNVNFFQTLYSKQEQANSPHEISTIYKRFMKGACNKLIWSILKQQGFNTIDMCLRDKFKYDHVKQTNSAGNKNANATVH